MTMVQSKARIRPPGESPIIAASIFFFLKATCMIILQGGILSKEMSETTPHMHTYTTTLARVGAHEPEEKVAHLCNTKRYGPRFQVLITINSAVLYRTHDEAQERHHYCANSAKRARGDN